MSEDQKNSPMDSAPAIQIERLNTDKTRKDSGSTTVYHLYFELSGYPLPEWREIFEREWKAVNPTEATSIEGAFLVLHSELREVATVHLPALQKAIAATNEAYKRYAKKEATALEHREDKWKQERKDVDAVAASLHFDQHT